MITLAISGIVYIFYRWTIFYVFVYFLFVVSDETAKCTVKQSTHFFGKWKHDGDKITGRRNIIFTNDED